MAQTDGEHIERGRPAKARVARTLAIVTFHTSKPVVILNLTGQGA